jgi:glutaredoxin
MVKQYLAQKGVSFEERDVNANPTYAQELVTASGQMGVPVTVIDGEFIIGFDKPKLEQLINQKREGQRPSFGAAIADAAKITVKQGGEMRMGAYIGNIRSGSLANRMGLMKGDIITSLNLSSINNAEDMTQVLATLSRGDHVAISFLRGMQPLATEGIFKE